MRRAILALMLALAPAACAGHGGNAATRPRAQVARTYVQVVNRNFAAYTMYVVSGTQRQRLGTVQPVTTAQLLIPAAFVQTPVMLRFLADPIGSDAVASTFNINVTPGETVQITIF
ncbi:MAG TPA: hypothetical protein VF771_05690 [Longimicrobiaceae bacterium]